MVPTKRASVPLYSEFVHDEWVSFLTELYEWGSRQWQYLVPEDPGARRRLRRLCARMLAFENHYLEQYRTYLLDELRKSTDSARYALAQLAVVRFADDECCAAVEAVAALPDEPIREEALSALRSIREARV